MSPERRALPADTWMTVTGKWAAGGVLTDPEAIPVFRAESMLRIDPYH